MNNSLLSADCSEGQEPLPIPLINEIDNERPDFEYINQEATPLPQPSREQPNPSHPISPRLIPSDPV